MTRIAGARALRSHVTDRFTFESGETLSNVQQVYHLDGRLNAGRDNLVILVHSLTGTADAVGDWWADVAGPGRAIDTERFAVLAPNLVGSCYGSTGPAECAPAPFPRITTRDQGRLIHEIVQSLGVRSVAMVTGGSLGGMVALEYAATFPSVVRSAVIFSAPAAHSAWGIGWNHIQRELLEIGGARGLALARMVGMMSYRTEREFEQRFERRADRDGAFTMARYLEHHGDKLVARFDAATYRVLIDAMDAHDVGRDRGGIERALEPLAGRLTAVGIPGDVLYSVDLVRDWARRVRATYRDLHSACGHDAFLLEHGQVGAILREAIGETERAPAGRATAELRMSLRA